MLQYKLSIGHEWEDIAFWKPWHGVNFENIYLSVTFKLMNPTEDGSEYVQLMPGDLVILHGCPKQYVIVYFYRQSSPKVGKNGWR